MLALVLRRSSRRADAAFAAQQDALREAVIARTAREAERQQNLDLHDTVLSTLTMVGLGAVGADSALLRERAAADLRTLATTAVVPLPRHGSDGPRGQQVPADGSRVALAERLGEVRARVPELPVHVAFTADVPVPTVVAEAVAASVDAALSNVRRHAPQATVRLELTQVAGTVVVRVVDDGPGFDPTRVPPHRYGIRESIRGRMAAVGGRAVVDSAPGEGTRVRLEWPDGS